MKQLTLLVLLSAAFYFQSKAQLFPAGTKIHVAHLTSYFETKHQQYLNTNMDTITINGNLYTNITYPGGGSYALRIDSNKLFTRNFMNNNVLLFDFNANIGDSLTIYHYYYFLSPPEIYSIADIRIDSIDYEYFYNEENKRDSLKQFFYSGAFRYTLNPNNIFDTSWLPLHFRNTITERIITSHTSTVHSYLGINLGYLTTSDDHERLRCIEFPDGKTIKMEWWYNLAGNAIPCNYTFNLGQQELVEKPSIIAHPNPTNQFIILSGYSGPIIIHNIIGQVVFKTIIKNETEVDLHNLENGLYYIQLPENNQKSIPILINR